MLPPWSTSIRLHLKAKSLKGTRHGGIDGKANKSASPRSAFKEKNEALHHAYNRLNEEGVRTKGHLAKLKPLAARVLGGGQIKFRPQTNQEGVRPTPTSSRLSKGRESPLMASPAVYTDLAAARENAINENVDVIVETQDYTEFPVTPPGEYLTPFRTIGKVTDKSLPNGEKTTTFEIHLTGGVKDLESGQAWGAGKYPFKAWLSTTLFTQNGKPGKTSQVSQYLKEAGFDPKTLKTKSDIIDAMEASLGVPMKVYIGRKSKGVKQPDNSWLDAGLKTKDFIVGNNPDGTPLYAASVVVNGVEVKGIEKVGSFRRF